MPHRTPPDDQPERHPGPRPASTVIVFYLMAAVFITGLVLHAIGHR